MEESKNDTQEECSYPDCGCPEARLCMAGNPNHGAVALNRPPRSKITGKRVEVGKE